MAAWGKAAYKARCGGIPCVCSSPVEPASWAPTSATASWPKAARQGRGS